MYTYTWNKIFSLLIPITTIVVVSWYISAPKSWTVLLIIVSLLGYTHYILGAYYQHRAWIKRTRYLSFCVWFLILTLVSVLIIVIASLNHLVWLVALLTIPYFVWHGYENEFTLFARATGQHLPVALMQGISLVAVGLTLDAFRHASAGFSHSLSYGAASLFPSTSQLVEWSEPTLFFVGLVCVLVGLVMLGIATYQYPSRITRMWLGIAMLLVGWFWYANPLPYIWLFVLLLSYHFLTWAIHFGVVFWPQEVQFFSYVYAHGLVVGVILVSSFILTQTTPAFTLGLLNTEFFLAATLIHITTSFLNEQWLQQRLGI